MAQDNKFLTFKLSDESYGIPILKVKEIIGMMTITKVPKLPKFIKGVVNLRGEIIPLIDLRLKFDLDEREYDDRTSVIVIEINIDGSNRRSGIIVDIVQEVMDIQEENIENPPKYGTNVQQEFLTGMGKSNDDVIMLLDVDRIFTDGEKEILDSVKS